MKNCKRKIVKPNIRNTYPICFTGTTKIYDLFCVPKAIPIQLFVQRTKVWKKLTRSAGKVMITIYAFQLP